MSDIAKFLRDTAQVIKHQGWDTGSWGTTGPVCVEGAMLVVMGKHVFSRNADRSIVHNLHRHEAYLYMHEYLGLSPYTALYEWNDRLSSESTVLNALEMAAVVWEKEQEAQTKSQTQSQRMIVELPEAMFTEYSPTYGTKPITNLQYAVVETQEQVPDYVPDTWSQKVKAKVHSLV